MSNTIDTIVIGAGRLGSNIARQLSRQEDVLLVDISKDELSQVTDFTGFMEVGDATDLSFLEENGVRNLKRIVIITEDDNTNIFLADVCYHIFGLKEIYIRLKDSRKMKLVDSSVKCICPFDLSLEDFEIQMQKEVAR
ncbi:MAG: NAD-binding protein [Erysipelotrichaceae bacterium]|nr:NAD-binding protein [Erysipelotrichaceae bacterium]